jgi:hypothetical protein
MRIICMQRQQRSLDETQHRRAFLHKPPPPPSPVPGPASPHPTPITCPLQAPDCLIRGWQGEMYNLRTLHWHLPPIGSVPWVQPPRTCSGGFTMPRAMESRTSCVGEVQGRAVHRARHRDMISRVSSSVSGNPGSPCKAPVHTVQEQGSWWFDSSAGSQGMCSLQTY